MVEGLREMLEGLERLEGLEKNDRGSWQEWQRVLGGVAEGLGGSGRGLSRVAEV